MKRLNTRFLVFIVIYNLIYRPIFVKYQDLFFLYTKYLYVSIHNYISTLKFG